MTYSLNTLNNSGASAASPRAGVGRFAHEIALVLGAGGPGLLAAGPGELLGAGRRLFPLRARAPPLRNWGGRLGAWLADASYFLLGFSVWWCFAAAMRAWLATLARWMRGEAVPQPAQAGSRARAWLSGSALAVLLCASTALEWSRLYRFEARLPDHAGRRAGLPGGAAGREVAGLHRLRPGVRRAGRAGRGRRVPLLLEPCGRADGRRASTASSSRAAKSARSRRTWRSASRRRAQREEIAARGAHRDRGAPSRRRC